jgi:hypothetical protein
MKIKILTGLMLLAALQATCSAAPWAPLEEERRKEGITLMDAIIAGEPIFYVSESLGKAKGKRVPDIENAMQSWFKNVIERRAEYKNFDETFTDILPILERGATMEPFPSEKYPNADPSKVKMFFYFVPKLEDIPGNSDKYAAGLHKINAEGVHLIYTHLPSKWSEIMRGINAITIPNFKAGIAKHILIHEIGHALGLGDLYSGAYNADFEYGSGIKKSVMNESAYGLTCDDADGLIGVMDLARGVSRKFYSFCNDGSYYIDGVQYDKNGRRRALSKRERKVHQMHQRREEQNRKIEELNRKISEKGKEIGKDFAGKSYQDKFKEIIKK